MERQDKASKKRKVSDSQQNIDNYHDYTVIPDSRITRINHALIKFFVACGISFRIVVHPFFFYFLKELNAGYDLPTRLYFAGELLERELAQINSKVKLEIEKKSNLTLGLLNDSI